MKRHTIYFTGFLIALLLAVILPAGAADKLNFTKTISAKALPDNPKYLLVNLYASKDDSIPVATQSFVPGEWQVSMQDDNQVLEAPLDDLSYLDETPYLWAETSIDGNIVGPRQLIAIVAPGITAPGLIESTVEGFKFPDATVQTTAGISSADLAAHQANASAHHSPLIDTSRIIDGTITGADVNTGSSFTVGALTIEGNNGSLQVHSENDIRIYDDYNGLRWFTTDGNAQLAYITVQQGAATTFGDVEHGRTLLYSNSNGIGIGTASPTASHAVTMPSLNVIGNLEIGLVRVSANYNLSSSASCHSSGNLTCYYGSGTVQCPAGTRVLGGGVGGILAANYGSSANTYPANTTSWECASTYDLGGTSDTCYAICARLE
jgi:hypothetical protein